MKFNFFKKKTVTFSYYMDISVPQDMPKYTKKEQ